VELQFLILAKELLGGLWLGDIQWYLLSYPKKATRKFKCPHCHKKSPIITTKGELANLCFKRINKPEIDNIPYETIETPQAIEQ
jgi:hypothetical protein